MTESRTSLRVFLILGVAMICWAGNSIVGRAIRDDIPPFTLAFGRWTIAFLLLLPFALRHILTDWATIREKWLWIVVLGLFGVTGFNTFLYMGLHYTTATNALLLQAGIPLLVVTLDRIIFGGRPHPWQAAGVIVSTLGVLWIVFRGDPAVAFAFQFGAGDLLVLASITAWSFYTVLLRKRPLIAPLSFMTLTFAVGSVTLAPFALGEWLMGRRIVWGPAVPAAYAYVALAASLLAYFIYNWAAVRLGPARTGQALTLMPLFGAVLSALLLGEQLHAYHIAGMVFILGGIMMSALALRAEDTAGVRNRVPLEDAS